VVAKDPDTGVYNLSYHRMQLQGPNQFGISLHSRGHLWDYFRRAQLKGQDLEVAVIVGCHPAVYLAASSKIGIGEDECALAGALLGEGVEMVHCNTVELLVPASSELVLEGRIKADHFEDEGPFGEYTGYSTSRSTRTVMEVTCVMRREKALFMDLVPGFSCEHLLLGGAAKEAEILYLMKDRFHTVEDVYFPKSGTHFHAYIKMKKTAEGQPRQAMALLTGLDMYLKTIITVDDDIDIHSDEDVLWALATRMQPDERIMILPKLMCNVLDPSSHDGLSSKLLIDATLPLGQLPLQCREEPKAAALAQSLADRL
jgi:4-hydroxy-3-polyprenylbenzoate decarboxylase